MELILIPTDGKKELRTCSWSMPRKIQEYGTKYWSTDVDETFLFMDNG
jgi:hypothetical protein